MTSVPPQTAESAQAAIERAGEAYRRLRQEVGKVVVGQSAVVEKLMLSLLCRGHCLVVGVPGLAKTLLIRTLAQALDLRFTRVQFTPDLMPADILGTEILFESKETGERAFRFVRGPVFTNLFLADEINRAPPKTQSALLEAMQERTVTCGGETHPLVEPFLVFATQNPIEHEGTYPLPEAQLDRFLFNIRITYPAPEEELRIIDQNTTRYVGEVSTVFAAEEILSLQRLILDVPAPVHVRKYALALAAATRPDGPETTEYVRKYVEWGAGPRASIALVLAAKALAILRGQVTVSSEEIRAVYPDIFRHRVIPSYHAVGEGIDVETLLQRVVETTEEPRYRSGL